MINTEIKPDWALVYTGVIKNWLSPEDALSIIDPELINALDPDKISDLYVSQDMGKEAFVKSLEKIKPFTQQELIDASSIWGIYFLQNIYKSEKDIQEKLRDIADIWAMLDYPISWKQFIYYQPAEEGNATGNEALYERFLLFLKEANVKLSI